MSVAIVNDSDEEETMQDMAEVLPDGMIWYPRCETCNERIIHKVDLYLNCPVCTFYYCIDCFHAGREVEIKFQCSLCFEWVCSRSCTLVCRECGHTHCEACFQNQDNYFGKNICRNCNPSRIESNDDTDHDQSKKYSENIS
jgi:hypothetical protein